MKPDWTSEWSSIYAERPCEPWGEDVAFWAADRMYKLMDAAQPLLEHFWSEERAAMPE